MTSIRWLILATAGVAAGASRTPQPEGAPRRNALAKSAVDVVEAQLEAYNAQNLEAFAATYAEDVVVTSGPKNEVLVQGKDALRKRYAGLFQKYPNNRCRVAERRTEGERGVLDHEIITGRGPEKPDPWDVGWVRYEVEGGLVRSVQLP